MIPPEPSCGRAVMFFVITYQILLNNARRYKLKDKVACPILVPVVLSDFLIAHSRLRPHKGRLQAFKVRVSSRSVFANSEHGLFNHASTATDQIVKRLNPVPYRQGGGVLQMRLATNIGGEYGLRCARF